MNTNFKNKLDSIKIETRNKWEQFKFKARHFWVNNKEFIIVATPIVGTFLMKGVTQIGKNRNHKKEQDLKDLYIYDRSAGHYWPLNRPLKSSEWIEIDVRKANRERMYDILSSMRVLR